MTEAWIVQAVRTPIGRHRGALAAVRPDDLAATALSELLRRADVPGREVDEVILGAANQAGEDNRNVARMASLLAGFPVDVPGVTVNRLCASGLEAVGSAVRRVLAGEARCAIGGGVESMSRAPWVVAKPEVGYPWGERVMFDSTIGWRFVNPELHRTHGSDSMGVTAENLALEYGISRSEQDLFALRSHEKALAAIDAGRFAGETVPIDVGADKPVSVDEGPRRDASLERLQRLRPAFRADGTVTAGNSSSLNDGAAAVLVCSSDFARAHGLRPLARVLGSASAGVAPRTMGIGPVPATANLLQRHGRKLAHVDVIELNEAFAAQALAVLREWQIDPEDSRLNPNGGAIALGHPLGCSGARLVCSAVWELQRRSEAELGLVTMCVGVGQGVAMLMERLA